MANPIRLKRGPEATLPIGAAGEPLFTTDTHKLFIGDGSANHQFQPAGAYLTSVTADSPLSGAGTAASHLVVDLSGRQPLDTGLTSLAGLTYVSAAFVKMTGVDTFTLDTATYEPADATIVKTGNASWIDLTDGGATTLHSHAGGSGHVVQDEGTPLTARANLNFVGAGVAATDDAGNNATIVTITAGSGDISGTGVVGQVAEFVTNTKTIQAAKIIGPATNILTLTNAAASTLALNITAAKTLTLTAADNYTLTIPATGTAALLATANVFTQPQTIDVGTGIESLKLVDGATTKAALKWIGTNVYLDLPSVEPTNKLLNPTFDTDLTSWSEVPSYTLNDQFTTARTAGNVNGTSAEPTGGTRTVTDTNSKLSITGSQLSFATGGVAYGNPGLWYSSLTRASGKILTGTVTVSTTGELEFGFDTNQTGARDSNAFYFDSTNIYSEDNSSTYRSIGTGLATGTTYNLAVVLRSTGAYFYIKGGTYTNWTLLWISSAESTATLYPAISGRITTVFTADNIRIPTATWLPTPLAYDTFTRADGAIGSSETTGPDSQTTPSLAWTGGAISTNKNVITPTLGSELIVNGGFATDTDWTKQTGWTIGGGVANLNVGAGSAVIYQTKTATLGTWYLAQADLSNLSGGGSYGFYLDGTFLGYLYSTNGTKYASARVTSGASNLYGISSTHNATHNADLDNISYKPLTLSSLFSSVSTSDADVIADANVTLTAGTQAGLVLNLDSTSSPANFIIVYHDGTSVKVDEAVAGVYTNKQTTTVTYSAGATLRAIREGTKLRVYYNNALVGAELTMTANTNTKHGLFSTYSGNSFDNFTLWPRGSGTTKFTDAPFEELTVTRDTTTKYAGAASAKLVAGGTDANFLQSINVGDTLTYNLTCYVYTTGAAVTSADLSLYYGTAILSTTFTSVGSGWYRLSGTLTGVNATKDFGVRVKSGKTVYVDSFSLQSGTGVTTYLSFLNSGTGNLNYDVEGQSTLRAGVATEVAAIMKGFSGQTANIAEIQSSVGVVLSSFDASGVLTVPFINSVVDSAATSSIVNAAMLRVSSTGTAAAGLGAGLLFSLETATASTMQNAARVYAVTIDATNATRKYALVGTAFDTAEREGWRVEASGTAAKIGLYGVATVARATNAIAAGAFVANTSGIVNDSATYSGYTLGQVVQALQNIGILT